jgi:hypothetical protein
LVDADEETAAAGVGLDIRFVDRLPAAIEWIIGDDDAAWSASGFVLRRSRFKTRARVRLDLDASPPVVTAERGLVAIPHLVALVNLAALQRDVLPLHASAFSIRGRGVLATGWSKGGKTELVLGALSAGGSLIGDEWVYVTPTGELTGLGEPIRLWDWQLRQMPELARRLKRRERARLVATRTAADALTELTRMPAVGRSSLGRTAGRIAEVARRQLDVQVPPDLVASGAQSSKPVRADVVVLARAWTRREYSVAQIAGEEVAARMAASLVHERRPLLETYDQFRFAFPDRSSRLIDDAPRLEAELLRRALGGLPALVIDHPRAFEIHRLWVALEQHLA